MRIKDLTNNGYISEGPKWDRLNKLVQDVALNNKRKEQLKNQVNSMNNNQLKDYVERGINQDLASFEELFKYELAVERLKNTKTISESKKKL